jgi:hypothetical protein
MGTRATRVRDKLPEITLEAFSVLLAVFCALGVDQWRETCAQKAQGELARQRITSEVRRNTSEIEQSIPNHEQVLTNLDAGIEALERGDEISQVGANFEMSTYSDSAWETAKSTQTLNYVEFDWVVEITEFYELLEHCQASQREVLKHMSSLGDDSDREPTEVLSGIRGRISIVLELQRALVESSREAIGLTELTDDKNG